MQLNFYNYGASEMPKRSHKTDAGMDVRFTAKEGQRIKTSVYPANEAARIDGTPENIEFAKDTLIELDENGPELEVKDGSILIPAGVTVKLPLGFGIEIPYGYAGYIDPRSGISSRGFVPSHAPIDTGYTGEVHAIMTNMNHYDLLVNVDTRVAQLVIHPILTGFDLVDKDPNTVESERGASGFGSTGTK